MIIYIIKPDFRRNVPSGRVNAKRTEYILEWNLLEKKCKTAFTYLCYLLGPGTSFYRNSEINIKRNPNYGFIIDQL